MKQGGLIRRQFLIWKVPNDLLERAKLHDGDSCRVSISVGAYRHAGTYVLTSGGEFRLPLPVGESLASLSVTESNSAIEFNIFKGKMIGDENAEFDKLVAESRKLSGEERRRRLNTATKVPKRRRTTVWEFLRNPDVVAEALARANGNCEGCKVVAPFLRASDQSPYLEVHHKERLADGGFDVIENAIALCPNCHRRSHYA